jgi:hypothetical protein
MTIEQTLSDCKTFDVTNASLSLWVFKKSYSQNANFTARSVIVTDALKDALKEVVTSTLARCTEVEPYTLLAQPVETGCLCLETDETIFSELQVLIDLPTEEHLIQSVKQIENSTGYVVRLQLDGGVLYCVHKLSENWRTTKRLSVINAVLNGNQLDLVEDRTFLIGKSFDFFATATDILVINKANFESLMNYKLTYVNSFASLRQDATFSAVFTNMAPVIDHVGTNTMHLRRMAVIQQRGLYADATYMTRLRQVNGLRNWNITFDAQGRIEPTDATMRTIMQVLLNHRLRSELTETDFDVNASTQVN